MWSKENLLKEMNGECIIKSDICSENPKVFIVASSTDILSIEFNFKLLNYEMFKGVTMVVDPNNESRFATLSKIRENNIHEMIDFSLVRTKGIVSHLILLQKNNNGDQVFIESVDLSESILFFF